MSSSRSLSSSEELFVHLLRSRPPRLHEAIWVAEHRLHGALGARSSQQLQVARMDDNRLEEAIVARDEMRHHKSQAAIRLTLAQFLDKYPNITFLPMIRLHAGVVACAKRALMGVAALGGAAAVFESPELLSKALAMLHNLAAAAEHVVLSHVCGDPSELLLHSALVDLSRLALRSSLVGGGTLQQVPACVIVDLLHMMRSIVANRISEEVRAVVSLSCAELLAFFDEKLPTTVALPTAEKRGPHTEPVCYLTGVRLTSGAVSSIMVGGVEHRVTAVSGIYWNATSKCARTC